MHIVYAPAQLLHAPTLEFNRGALVEPHERPSRPSLVLAALQAVGMTHVHAPARASQALIETLHDPQYLTFLQDAPAEWRALGREGDALPLSWPARGLRRDRRPSSLDGRLAYYAFDISTPLTQGAWAAARAAAEVAMTGAARLAATGERGVFSLCRPPGHHAHRDLYGGYCFLNNAGLAAQHLRDLGAARVAIIDVDYHHGNGTQDLFYDRDDVLYVSIHADPATDFPFFLGYGDEMGAGAGEGFNLNLPLARGADWAIYREALEAALAAAGAFGPDALVVSLGVDTYAGDPLGHFHLTGEDFRRLGARIAQAALPTLFVMEGGYAIQALGDNVAAVLTAFDGG